MPAYLLPKTIPERANQKEQERCWGQVHRECSNYLLLCNKPALCLWLKTLTALIFANGSEIKVELSGDGSPLLPLVLDLETRRPGLETPEGLLTTCLALRLFESSTRWGHNSRLSSGLVLGLHGTLLTVSLVWWLQGGLIPSTSASEVHVVFLRERGKTRGS